MLGYITRLCYILSESLLYLPEISAYSTSKSGGYLPVSGGHLALVMAKVTTTNHCGQNTVMRIRLVLLSSSLNTIQCLYFTGL